MRYLKTSITLLACQSVLCLGAARADVIAAWHFDETMGSTAFAAVGSVDGTLMGDASFITGGVSGRAASMSKSGLGFIDMGDNFSLDGNSTFSIVAWVRLNSDDAEGYIVTGRHHAGTANGHLLSINDVDSGSGEVDGGAMFYQAYPNPVTVDLGLNDGGWHQLVGVHDFAGNQARLFVDGVLRDSVTYDDIPASDANFAVGGVLNPDGTQMVSSLTGAVDEVSIWDHALTSSEVTDLFNNPGRAGVPEPSGLALLSGLSIAGIMFRRRRSRPRKIGEQDRGPFSGGGDDD